MRLAHLRVQNFRGLRDVELPLSTFGCFIGKNNAGKSTLLQAIAEFFAGTKLSKSDYFEPKNPIHIEIKFEGIGDVDLNRLATEHRERIEPVIKDGKLTLTRFYEAGGSTGKLMYMKLLPTEERFRPDRIAALVKGSGKTLVTAVCEVFPELKQELATGSVLQARIKEAIETLGERLPDEQKHPVRSDLPTGIEASIKKLLPDTIHIQAVKNLADDVKVKDSTPFGKLLSILLEKIEPKLGQVQDLFDSLTKHLNRVPKDDGTETDDRLDDVREIESTVENFLKESFADVKLELKVPPPDLKTILSSAELFVDDGVRGEVGGKGDGLRRATVFAILRAYAKLHLRRSASGPTATTAGQHVLLFEEPELYLHPAAQKILFDALNVFSEDNHVFITTHSPAFLEPTETVTFTKLTKVRKPEISKTPFTTVHAVTIEDLKEKDKLQLICYENNNAGFFFDSVILVEGDSDLIVLPHLATLILPGWRLLRRSHKFIRINGKGNIRRYREFFKKFDVHAAVIADLDLLLGGFDHINPSQDLYRERDHLVSLVDEVIKKDGGFKKPSNQDIGDAYEKTELVWRYQEAKRRWDEAQSDTSKVPDFFKAMDHFYEWEKRPPRLKTLATTDDAAILKAKRKLIKRLREQHVYVLERGAIEQYYPQDFPKGDKPTQALSFCKAFKTKAEVLALCDEHFDDDGKSIGRELEIICTGLFG